MRFPWKKKRYYDSEIAPDEIFLDDVNEANLNRDMFEGRLEKPLSANTYLFLAGTLTLLFLGLAWRAWYLQVENGHSFAKQSARNSLEREVLFAKRGVVTDINGVPLITNAQTDLGFVERIYRTPAFSTLLGHVSYPKKDSSGNYYDTTLRGLSGIEAEYDTLLSGKDGTLLVERDALGNIESSGTVVSPKNGDSIALSIDVRVQEAFYSSISSLADRESFLGGGAVFMDVNTGEVHALVSYPEYDSNVLSRGGPSSVIAGYATDKRLPYLNRPVQGLYTPGSTVKPMEAAGALTDGVASPEYTINDTKGYITIPNPYSPDKPNVFVDWKIQGLVDLRHAIAFSSDIYFYIIGGGYKDRAGLGIERLAYWYRSFGFESLTGIDVPGEKSGFVPTPEWKEDVFGESWNIGDTYNTSIGQYSMQVTLVEMARAVGAVANGGILVTPTVRKHLSTPAPNAEPQGERVPITAESLQIVREGMRDAVLEGTAVGLLAYDSLVHLAGKTGTAQTGVNNAFHHSWVVGFFPYEKPKYAYVVMMDRGPSTTVYGGVYIMSEVLSELRQTAPEYFTK